MLGAVAGDVIGSVHEHAGTRTTDFELFVPESRFTDDTVLALAVASCVLDGGGYIDAFHRYVSAYPRAGYGLRFLLWAQSGDRRPYGSWGNGAAMRVPAIGHAFDRLQDVLDESERCAAVTHDHPDGITGAQATAAAVHLARAGHSRREIRGWIERLFGYDPRPRLDDIRPVYTFDVSCQGTVPVAMIAFLESHDYEGAVRNAISVGGDADTLACIAGAIAEPFYGGVPEPVAAATLARLDDHLRDVVVRFTTRYPLPARPATASETG